LLVDNCNYCDVCWEGFSVVWLLRRNCVILMLRGIISHKVIQRHISNEWKLKLLLVTHGSYAKFNGESIGALYLY
jgi:hypothetical protein